jgi:hypothetical protein
LLLCRLTGGYHVDVLGAAVGRDGGVHADHRGGVMPGSTFPGQFETNERANAQPVHCYTFARGLRALALHRPPIDMTLSGVVYRAADISHTEYARDDESAAGELTITTADRRRS